MSTPYPPGDGEDRRDSSTMAQPATPATPDMDGHVHRPSPEVRQGYRLAAPIQRLAGVVSSFPGSGGRPRLEQGPESVIISVLF